MSLGCDILGGPTKLIGTRCNLIPGTRLSILNAGWLDTSIEQAMIRMYRLRQLDPTIITLLRISAVWVDRTSGSPPDLSELVEDNKIAEPSFNPTEECRKA